MNTNTNTVIYKVDVTDKSVQYNGNTLTFRTDIATENQVLPGTQAQIEVLLEEGVALPAEGGECGSEANVWQFTVKGK